MYLKISIILSCISFICVFIYGIYMIISNERDKNKALLIIQQYKNKWNRIIEILEKK